MADWPQTTLKELIKQLEDEHDPLTIGLQGCGPDTLLYLRGAAQELYHKPEQASEALESLAQLAYSELSASRAAPTCWRRLYTDAKILQALSELVSDGSAEACVARLDHTIIIAGPCGEGRLHLVLDLIEAIQSRYLQSPARPSILYHRTPYDFPAPQSPTPVSRLANPPSFTSFLSTYSRSPFVISGYAKGWPATRAWSDLQYLRTISGPGRVVPVEVGSDYRATDWTQRLMNWDVFLDSLTLRDAGEVLYLAQHNLFKQFPRLRDDVIIPDYVYASLPATADFPAYKPPQNEDELLLNIWLGPVGTVSPAHTDPYYNFYAQVVGRKTVWLAPPSVTPYMSRYSYPATDSSTTNQSHNPAANNTEPSMSNTSRVNVFGAAGKDEFPDFWDHAAPRSMWITLEPGDVLFFPPGWWHAMRSEEMSFSVSMWF